MTVNDIPAGTYITVRDAARRLGVSRQRLYQLIDGGRLEAVRVGEALRKMWLVNEEALRKLLTERNESFQRQFYLARLPDERVVRVRSDGHTFAPEVELGIERVKRWALVLASTLSEARRKFECGEVLWLSPCSKELT